MGNAASSAADAGGVEPTDAQVDEIFAAMKKTFDESTSSLGGTNADLLMIKLRAKLQDECPSPMGGPRIDPDITSCIGQTNLVRINKISADKRVAEVVAKVEYTNPGLR